MEVTQHDVVEINDATLRQAYYGELSDFPHMFEFTLLESTTIFAEIVVPDIEEAKNDKSGLLLQVLDNDEGVREIKRLGAKDAPWSSFFVWSEGNSYRRGPTYYDSLEPGTYQFEVSTPINQGKYVLLFGTRDEIKGYFSALRDVAQSKEFFEKSRIALIESPLVYIPALLLIVGSWATLWLYRRRTKQTHSV